MSGPKRDNQVFIRDSILPKNKYDNVCVTEINSFYLYLLFGACDTYNKLVNIYEDEYVHYVD